MRLLVSSSALAVLVEMLPLATLLALTGERANMATFLALAVVEGASKAMPVRHLLALAVVEGAVYPCTRRRAISPHLGGPAGRAAKTAVMAQQAAAVEHQPQVMVATVEPAAVVVVKVAPPLRPAVVAVPVKAVPVA